MTTKKVWDEISSNVSAAIPVAVECLAIEEEFAIKEILMRVALDMADPVPVYTWNCAMGFRLVKYSAASGLVYEELQGLAKERLNSAGGDPLNRFFEAITKLAGGKDPTGKELPGAKGLSGIFIFLDAHKFLGLQDLNGLRICRMVQILIDKFRTSGNVESPDDDDYGHSRRLIVLGENINILPELRRIIPKIAIGLPDEDELRAEMEAQSIVYASNISYEGYSVPALDDEETWKTLTKEALGLSLREVALQMQRSANDFNELGLRTADLFHQLKISNLKNAGLTMERIPEIESGGLNEFKRWFRQRAALFSRRNISSRIRPLKGFLVVGAPGCGKSLIAKEAGRILHVPVFRLNADQIFGSLVGESEQKMRRILTLIESVAPCILWADEVEKLLSSSATDSVATRIIGQFLTWMQENQAPVITICTANNIEALPPELTRKGRFDEIFFVDLPQYPERQEIARIHLTYYGEKMSQKQIEALIDPIAEKTKDYSGAEIEAVVTSALMEAMTRGEDGLIYWEDIEAELARTMPLAKQQPERILTMRKKAENFRAAYVPIETQPKAEASAMRSATPRMRRVRQEAATES